MPAHALRKIAAELMNLAEESETDRIDPFRLMTIERQVAAQREMVEGELES